MKRREAGKRREERKEGRRERDDGEEERQQEDGERSVADSLKDSPRPWLCSSPWNVGQSVSTLKGSLAVYTSRCGGHPKSLLTTRCPCREAVPTIVTGQFLL